MTMSIGHELRRLPVVDSNWLLTAVYAVFACTVTAMAADRLPELSPSIQADAEYLLNTNDLMEAQYGMAVDAVQERPDQLTVRTTGAEFVIDLAGGRMSLNQRLGRPREAGCVTFSGGALKGLKVARQGTGALVLSIRDGALRMRINGDSLLMLRSTQPLTLAYTVNFTPATVRRRRGNLLILDEWGGLGSYVAAGKAEATLTWPDVGGAARPRVTYALEPGQILWLALAPPKPFDWGASFRDRVVWHWSRQTGYPSDSQIEQWSQYGNVLLQQAEMMLWKDWALRFVPRNGVTELERVNRTCERLGMRNIVYTSPYYFLTGTGKEGMAVNSFGNFAVTRFGPADSRAGRVPGAVPLVHDLLAGEVRRLDHHHVGEVSLLQGAEGEDLFGEDVSAPLRRQIGVPQ